MSGYFQLLVIAIFEEIEQCRRLLLSSLDLVVVIPTSKALERPIQVLCFARAHRFSGDLNQPRNTLLAKVFQVGDVSQCSSFGMSVSALMTWGRLLLHLREGFCFIYEKAFYFIYRKAV